MDDMLNLAIDTVDEYLFDGSFCSPRVTYLNGRHTCLTCVL